jgi:hypothetical protein
MGATDPGVHAFANPRVRLPVESSRVQVVHRNLVRVARSRFGLRDAWFALLRATFRARPFSSGEASWERERYPCDVDISLVPRHRGTTEGIDEAADLVVV